MAVIHMSETEAARDFANMLAKVRAGAEVRIDGTVAISTAAQTNLPRKTLSEAIRLAKERGLKIVLDDEFGRDLEQVVLNHEHEAGMRDIWAE